MHNHDEAHKIMPLILMNNQILTIHDVVCEDDAFEYAYNYSDWVEIILNKERPVNAIKTNRPQKIT